jgi:hypothetical protein
VTNEELSWWNSRAEECRQINYVSGRIWEYLCEHHGASNLEITQGLGLDRSFVEAIGQHRRNHVARTERGAREAEEYLAKYPSATTLQVSRALKFTYDAVERYRRQYLG